MNLLKRFLVKGGIDNNSKTIVNVADPVNDQDASTKKYSSNASNLSTGTLSSQVLPALSGDVTSSAGSSVTSLSEITQAGTYGSSTEIPQIHVDSKGRVTTVVGVPVQASVTFDSLLNKPTTLNGYGIFDAVSTSSVGTANGVAPLDSSGKVPTSVLPAFVDDVLEFAGLSSFPSPGEKGKIYVDTTNNSVYRWTGSTYLQIDSSVGSADTAIKLATGRTISISGDVSGSSTPFDGTANISFTANLSATGVTPGTYNNVTVDSKGRVSLGANQPYITANQPILVSGDVSGSGTNTINLTLANSGVTAGTYNSVTVDAKGRVTAGTLQTFTNQTISVSGDVSGSGSTALFLNLSNTGVTAGTYNSVTVDAKGRVTAGTNQLYLTANQNITISGDAIGTGSTSIALTLANSGVTAGTYNSVTVDAKGRVTAGTVQTYGNQAITISGDATGTGTTAITLALANSGVTAGTYNSVTVDAKGRVTAGTVQTYANQNITVSGDVSGSGTTALSLVLSNTGVTAGTYNSVTVDAKGRVTSASNIPTVQSISITGDATGSGTSSIALSLTNTGVTAGTYNSVTVDAKGRVTAGTNQASIQNITVTGDVVGSGTSTLNLALSTTGVSAGTYNSVTVDTKGRVTSGTAQAYLTTNQQMTFSGDVTGTGTTAIPLTLAASGVTPGTYTSVTVDAKGRVTSGSTASSGVALTHGNIATSTFTTSATTANQVADTFPVTTYRSVKYMVQITSSTSYQVGELIAVHDGTTVYLVESGGASTSVSLTAFDADISSGNFRLLVTPTNATTTYKIMRIALAV